MHVANVLYDEDTNGQLFQIDSAPCADGFFFEIVQREGYYLGYGAPNAPFRIAAQKRSARPARLPRF
jgi:4-hydroxyphenylpyruvate dioxygenase